MIKKLSFLSFCMLIQCIVSMETGGEGVEWSPSWGDSCFSEKSQIEQLTYVDHQINQIAQRLVEASRVISIQEQPIESPLSGQLLKKAKARMKKNSPTVEKGDNQKTVRKPRKCQRPEPVIRPEKNMPYAIAQALHDRSDLEWVNEKSTQTSVPVTVFSINPLSMKRPRFSTLQPKYGLQKQLFAHLSGHQENKESENS